MAKHTERTEGETMHRVKKKKGARVWRGGGGRSRFRSRRKSAEEGPGESRAKGVFGLGGSVEVKVPFGGQVGRKKGTEEERAGGAGSTLGYRFFFFRCEAARKRSGSMLKSRLAQCLLRG